MSAEPERVRLYIRSTVPCPACGGHLELTLEVGLLEALERQGITEAEVFEKVAQGLLSGRIVCPRCQEAHKNRWRRSAFLVARDAPRGPASTPAACPAIRAAGFADLAHANVWIETHWRRCRGPLGARGSNAVEASTTSSKVAAKAP